MLAKYTPTSAPCNATWESTTFPVRSLAVVPGSRSWDTVPLADKWTLSNYAGHHIVPTAAARLNGRQADLIGPNSWVRDYTSTETRLIGRNPRPAALISGDDTLIRIAYGWPTAFGLRLQTEHLRHSMPAQYGPARAKECQSAP